MSLEDIRAAIRAGHVAEVVVFCDNCRTEHRAAYTGEQRADRIATARRWLAGSAGWSITAEGDYCPDCTKAVPAR